MWRTALVAAALMATTLAVGGGSSDALPGFAGGLVAGSGPIAPGERVYAGLPLEVRPDLHCTPRLTAARVIGVDPGVTTAVQAVDRTEGSEQATLAVADEAHLAGVRLHPVTDVVLSPDGARRWYLMTVASADRPGVFHTRGLEVDYVCGGQTGRSDYGELLDLTVVPGR